MALINDNMASQEALYWLRAAVAGCHPALVPSEVHARFSDPSDYSSADTEANTLEMVHQRYFDDNEVAIRQAVDMVYVRAATTAKNEDLSTAEAFLSPLAADAYRSNPIVLLVSQDERLRLLYAVYLRMAADTLAENLDVRQLRSIAIWVALEA